jgi:hypothetical protein
MADRQRLIARVEKHLRQLAGTKKLTALDRKIARNIARGRLMSWPFEIGRVAD